MWNFDPGGMEASSNDLPLKSNIHDIRVKHYLLDLKVNLKDRVFTGSTTLFLEQPASCRAKTCKTDLLPQACKHSDSCTASQGVTDKVKIAGDWSEKKDAVTDRAYFDQGLVESTDFLVTEESGCLTLRTDFDHVSMNGPDVGSESQGPSKPVCQSDRKGTDGDRVVCFESLKSEKRDASDTYSEILDGSNQTLVSDISTPAGSKSGQRNTSSANITEQLAPPCKRMKDGMPCKNKITSSYEQSLSHLSGMEAQLVQDKDFVMMLDCCDIDIQAVEEIMICKINFGEDIISKGETVNEHPDSPPKSEGSSHVFADKKATKDSAGAHRTAGKSLTENLCFKPSDYGVRRDRFLSCQSMESRPLEFEVEPWCLKIWKRGVKTPRDFPAAIRIRYRTRPCGRSLTWAVDQDGRPCVFTQGAWINNRSLFPCQEPPGAMATWQAIIHAPDDLLVVMSGDEEGKVLERKEGMVSSLHFTDMLQPSSIVTLAIGGWRCYSIPVPQPEGQLQPKKKHLFSFAECKAGIISDRARTGTHSPCNHDEWPCRIKCYDQPIIPSRIIAPPSILEAAVKEFSSYLPKCLHAVFSLLGPHPFSRLDVLILPRCFASLGLASPSLIFLSQSLLSGDGSFLPRLAHEISHSWFGILIGAQDWTEEWLSEGFSTFMEDPIHAVAQNWTPKQYQDHSQLKALLRYKALKAELDNTESELQIMRPMAEEAGTSKDGSGSGGIDVGFVKNGLNPDKWFLQVHYLKGYFLLHHIAMHLSMEKTLEFINLYVMRYHGQLVLSKDIFQLLFDEYPELKDQGVTMETIYSDWLDKAGMPNDLDPEIYQQGNTLISDVMAEVKRWKAFDRFHQKSKKKKRKKIKSSELHDPPSLKLTPDQLILLLEGILDAETMAKETLENLNRTYYLTQQNAEVRHRWCELVVKHKFTKAYSDVQHFLLEDQAMGVYLYGELMASEDQVQQELARDCFKSVAMEIDRGCYRTVHEMVFGEPAEREET